MPAGFTHIMLAKNFNDKSNHGHDDLENLLLSFIDYFQVGAIAPDLPYSQIPNQFNNEEEIADDFHWHDTNLVPLLSLNKIKDMPEDENKKRCLAFVLGHMAHIVADGVVHPYVRDKVGSYSGHETEHRLLEMRLDVLLAEHIDGTEINCAGYQDQIRNVLGGFDSVANLFSKVINQVYKKSTDANDIIKWVKFMETLFEAASNKHNQYYAYIPGISGFLYKDCDELKANKKQDLILLKDDAVGRDINFRGQDIRFFEDCLPKFYEVFGEIAVKAYKYVYEQGAFNEKDLPAINLDTGRTIINDNGYNLDNPVIYWEI